MDMWFTSETGVGENEFQWRWLTHWQVMLGLHDRIILFSASETESLVKWWQETWQGGDTPPEALREYRVILGGTGLVGQVKAEILLKRPDPDDDPREVHVPDAALHFDLPL